MLRITEVQIDLGERIQTYTLGKFGVVRIEAGIDDGVTYVIINYTKEPCRDFTQYIGYPFVTKHAFVPKEE